MNFYDRVTGNDMTKEFKVFEKRKNKLPMSYQKVWEEIEKNLWKYSDLTGRNLMPILNDALTLLEESAVDNMNIKDVVGDDIKGFCNALASAEGAESYRDKWREQLNNNVAKRFSK
jgi:DNA-binding ferritin-like protein (Dps family)